MKDPHYQKLCEISWQRKLTPDEQALLSEWLAAHPEDQADWESEALLNQSLASLPDVPVSNNFTARVVEAARLQAAMDERAAQPGATRFARWLQWLPKAALAAAVLAAGLLAYTHTQAAKRAEWAESLSALSEGPSLPAPEVLKDFDAIAAMSSAPAADEELLKAMQ
jgi:hypothetical protein